MTGPAPIGDSPPEAGWGEGGSRRFLALAGGRAVAQGLALGWFFAAARILSDPEYGELATAMAFFAICAAVGDLGTTRSVVRHIAADERTLWATFGHAILLRIGGGLLVGAVLTVAITVLPVPVDPVVVLLAGLIATASGLTELEYATLRSIGKVRGEITLLVVERILFVGIAITLVLRGAGPIAVLLVYLFTNTVSAIVGAVVVSRHRPDESLPSGPLTDAEARDTAVSFALYAVGPRLAPVLVALFASATAVGVFSVAQRPIEAMTLFALSTAAPVLPIVRSHISRGSAVHASHLAVSIVGAIAVAMVPMLVWFEISPTMALTVFFGSGRYEGAATVLRLLALTALTWCFRGVGEFILLGSERARRSLFVNGVGTGVVIGLGIPLVAVHGATGAALALVVAEISMVVLLVRSEPTLGDAVAVRSYTPAALVAVGSALALAVTRSSTAGSLVVVAVAEAVALLLAIRLVRVLELRA